MPTETEGDIPATEDPLAGEVVGTQSSLSEWIGPYIENFLEKGWALADMPYEAYTGPLTAPISSLQDQAFTGIAGLQVPTGMYDATARAGEIGDTMMGLSYDPYTFSSNYSTTGYQHGYDPTTFSGGYDPTQFGVNYDPTQFQNTYDANAAAGSFDAGYQGTDFMGNTSRWIDPGMAEAYMNPFMEQVLNPQLEEIRRQAEITRLNDASRLTQAGAFGGSRQAIMESEGWDNMARLMNETEGDAYRDAYNTGANIFGQDEERLLQALGMQDRSNQFGASMNLEAQRLADMARQFGSSQDMESQRLSDMALQFLAGKDLEAQSLTDSSNRFGSEQALEEQRLADLSKQFLSEQDLTAQELSDSSNRFLAEQDLESQRLSEASRQYGADYGLDALRGALEASQTQGTLAADELDALMAIFDQQLDAGNIERGIVQEGLDADKAQWEEERDWPFKMLQFLQSLTTGLPMEATNNEYMDTNWLTDFASGSGLMEIILDLIRQSEEGGGTTGGGPADSGGMA